VFSLGVLFVRMLTGPLPRPASPVEHMELLRARLREAHRDDPSFSDGLYTLVSELVDPDLATRPRDAQRLLEALLEVVPASSLRLPDHAAAAQRMQPFVAEDGAPCWPARQWTVLQAWDQPRRPTPAPGRVGAPSARAARRPEPRAVANDVIEPSLVAIADTLAAPVATPVAPVVPLVPRPAPRQRGLVGRVALGAAFLCTGTALGLAIAVAEPGATAAPAAASLAAIAQAPAAAPDAVEAPAVPTVGTLVVETTPSGVLTVDGQRLGPTPYQGSLPPGAHVVRVEAPGHQAFRARVELAPGRARHLVAALEPSPAQATTVARAAVVRR
jgi:hypothetical protein